MPEFLPLTAQTVPRPSIENVHAQDARQLRKNAPNYFIALIEAGVLENVSSIGDLSTNQVSVLEGGEMSAIYSVTNNGQQEIIKLRITGATAEAEALRAWEKAGVSVPHILQDQTGQPRVGIISLPGGDFTQYEVMEAVINEKGELAENGASYIHRHPEKAEELGRAMGMQLAKMHTAVAENRSFGPVPGLWKHDVHAGTWKDYLVSRCRYLEQVFAERGVDVAEIQKWIGNIDFPDKGVYVHDDFGTHNILITQYEPLEIAVFDPNPMVADPYWDLARIYTRLQIREATSQQTHEPKDRERFEREGRLTDALLKTYEETHGPVDEKRLLMNQIIQIAGSIRYWREQRATGERLRDITIQEALLKQHINRLATLGGNTK